MSRSKRALMHHLTSDSHYHRQGGALWEPAADIYRTPDGWKVKLDLAGVKPGDIEVLMEDAKLIVRGVRRDSVMTEGWSYYQLEITYSRFERILSIPCDLSHAEIISEYQDGWLILHITCCG